MDGYARLISGLLLVVVGAVLGIIGVLGYAMYSEFRRVEYMRKKNREDSFDRALNKFLKDLDKRKNEEGF